MSHTNSIHDSSGPTDAEIGEMVAQFRSQQFSAMEASARSLTVRYPSSGFAWKALGTALQVQNKDSLPALRRAAQLLPDDVETHANLGDTLRRQGNLELALLHSKRAAEINPNLAEVQCNLGNVFRELRQFNDAVSAFRRALAINPQLAQAHNNLGNVLQQMGGQHGTAINCYRQAISLNQNYAEAYNNLGNILSEVGDFDGAISSYQKAIALNPENHETHNNIALAMAENDQLNDAVSHLKQAILLNNKYADAHINLGNVFHQLWKTEDAIVAYRKAFEISENQAAIHSAIIYFLNTLPLENQSNIVKEAINFGQKVEAEIRPFASWLISTEKNKRLRVGFVSGDFREHSVGHFVDNVFSCLSNQHRDQIELVAYATHPINDIVSDRIKSTVAEWHHVFDLSDEFLAKKIHQDAIDILIDLSGHTRHNRLPVFAWKPAPVQASWLGYLGTTGLSTIDYLIADAWVLPDSDQRFFTEKIWHLPESFICFTPPQSKIPPAPPPVIRNGYITIGSFNNISKINDEVISLWSRVLREIPNSRLFLKAVKLKSPMVRDSVTQRFRAHGIDASRLILEGPKADRITHLACYHRLDFALDPFPYPGITTSIESLWMGVPVLSLAGQSLLSRQCIGILNNAGLPEWIAADEDDFVAKACLHAGNIARLATIHSSLREQVLQSALFTAPRFAAHFTQALQSMWAIWCEKNNL